MSEGFTKGPWVIETTENPHIEGASWRQIRAGENGMIVAEVFHDLGDPDPGLTDEDAEANAHLIASAPELYEALSECANIAFAPGDDFNSIRASFAVIERIANKALAKSRGERP